MEDEADEAGGEEEEDEDEDDEGMEVAEGEDPNDRAVQPYRAEPVEENVPAEVRKQLEAVAGGGAAVCDDFGEGGDVCD